MGYNSTHEIQYSTTHWYAMLFNTTNPVGCAITYEISSTNTSVIAPANLVPTVDISDGKYLNVTHEDSSQVIKTDFYLKASITDSPTVYWSDKLTFN